MIAAFSFSHTNNTAYIATEAGVMLKGDVMEFDHLFICVVKPGAESERLIEFGLTEGSSNQHPGQGTENRRFFFQNACIELLFAVDSDELSSDLTKPTKLSQRLLSRAPSVSPFGLCFRPSAESSLELNDSWSYQPQYLPEHLEVEVANSSCAEPMWFYLSFGSRPDSALEEKREPIVHGCGFKNLTSVKVSAPRNETLSDSALVVNGVAGVEFCVGEEHLLNIGFDDESQGKQHDFRPSLPLTFRW